MDPLVAAVRTPFSERLRGCVPEIDVLPNTNRIGGAVIWEDFESVSQHDRQHMIWELIRANVASANQQRISIIMTLTRDEAAVGVH